VQENTSDFIRIAIKEDIDSGRFDKNVITRFPPEPNGYMHIGHAKAAHINFGMAIENLGHCNLRFDDTNPTKEDVEYVEAFKRDLEWLGFTWSGSALYSSNYFDTLYEYAIKLIRKDLAYVCDLSQEDIRKYRGSLTKPGMNSPYRNRTINENLNLFEKMRVGRFDDGACSLRAKIDMTSGNLNMRDPVIYRVLKTTHHRTGDSWCIYPTYDFAHGQSDSIEGVTHSLCSLEFEDHRPLYEWFLDKLEIYKPRQLEFARLNLTNTVMSKRTLLQLVEQGHVAGWDDPRMPTISGMKRRGYTPKSIRAFCDKIGVAKRNNTVEVEMLEHCVREDLNATSDRVMAVLRPLKVVIENYPKDKEEKLEAVNNPENLSAGNRTLSFTREIYIDRDDFQENPSKKFYRLAPGKEVRLRYGYFITCTKVIKDEKTGDVIELRCNYDPTTRGGQAPDGRKVKGTIHWVSVPNSLSAEIRIYDHLFIADENNSDLENESNNMMLNPESLNILKDSRVEQSLENTVPGQRYQFERHGYFCVDLEYSAPNKLVFNRTVGLRDSWAKIVKKQRV